VRNIQCQYGGFLLLFMILGCGSTEVSSKDKTNVGYFVTVFNKSVDYICEDKRQTLEESGKFECASFPISFYMDNVKLGEISRIHRDGYVYPQDIILLEGQEERYTSDVSKDFLLVE